jgi:hypothetical protein
MQFACELLLLLYACARAWVTEIFSTHPAQPGWFSFLTHQMQPAARVFGFGLSRKRFEFSIGISIS